MGKSTAVRLFAEGEELDLLEVNLERHRDLDEVFGSFDTALVLENLSALTGKRVTQIAALLLWPPASCPCRPFRPFAPVCSAHPNPHCP